MTTHYEFGLRFRVEHETEGSGSLLYRFEEVESFVVSTVRRLIYELSKSQPASAFDGMVLYGTNER